MQDLSVFDKHESLDKINYCNVVSDLKKKKKKKKKSGCIWPWITKHYQKQQIINILWPILTPKNGHPTQFLRPHFTVSFLQSFIVVSTIRPSAVCKYLCISNKFYVQKVGVKTVRK